ncbi:MAG: hypothetical protein H8E44_44815 [Planctomycetes bacterium]|nr:hypothetical protein [Planctomycetota bacterium]MBL7037238.1 hypothetical protein [Pirellulaceae bacterium]
MFTSSKPEGMGPRYLTRLACLVAVLWAAKLPAQERQHDFGEDVVKDLHPKLRWICTEKFRGGYNYNAPLEFFPLAKKCGMNAIISRLEIANDPGGDVELAQKLQPGARTPDALRSYELIEPSSRLAKKLGLHWFYMLDLAGSQGNYQDGILGNPRRHNNGTMFAPTDDIYWTRVVENRFLRVANMVQGDEFQIDGFLIDPEMYALRGATPPGLDFGDYALGEFVKAMKLDFDFGPLSVEERREWIDQQGLTDELTALQFERIRALARRTRERIQAIHPHAVFGFFLWRDSLWFRAAAAGFSTPQTPCWVGPESTYPGGYGEDFLAYQDYVRSKANVPILFVPGLSLSSRADDDLLEVFKGNLYHRSIRTQGYWFWALSRAFDDRERRGSVMSMLATTNAELDRFLDSSGNYESRLRPGPLPAGTPLHLHETLLDARSWVGVPKAALPTSPPEPTPMQLRGLHTFVFQAEPGDELSFTIRNVRLGHYVSSTAVRCFFPDSSEIRFDDVPLNQSRQILVKANQPGAYVLAVTSHNNAFRVEAGTTEAVLYSPGPIHGCWGKTQRFRYFFYVPRGIGSFRLKLKGSGNEKATFRLFSPKGRVLLEEKHVSRSVEHEIGAASLAGRVCWLETTDIVEDHGFELIDIPNIFASCPAHLLVPKH